jgi:tetratricopeptide (TPR) repeat protein
MRQILGWMAVVVLCCAARASAGEEPPDARLQEAQTAFDKAITLEREGRYVEAVAQGEHALALREALLGDMHPEVASCQNMLGRLFWMKGEFDRAERLLLRGLSVREVVLGKNHPDVAQSLTGLANLYSHQGLFGRAEPLFLRALCYQASWLMESRAGWLMGLLQAAEHQGR